MKKTNTEHKLLDALREDEDLRSDAHLAEAFGFTRQYVCYLRKHGYTPDSLRIAIQRLYGWPLRKIDKLAPPSQGEKP